MRRIVGLVGLPLVLTACIGPSGSSAQVASLAPSPSASASAIGAVGSPAPTTSERIALDAALPRELDGVELHTFAVGQDILARLATELGVAIDDLEAAFASDHGARFLQMYAITGPGLTATALADGWGAVAYPPEVGDVAIADETMAGRTITVVHSPSTAPRLGTFYLDRRGERLIVVQAFAIDVAVRALESLP